MATIVKEFNYTGTLQIGKLPAGVSSMDIYLWGGAGGSGGSDYSGDGSDGAAGHYIEAKGINTSAYAGEIFYGALRAVPSQDLESADAFGFTGIKKFRRIIWPTMLRLAWPSYTNEAIFMFHATTLVFFTGFPAWQQKGDAIYYASYFADKTFNPFVPYPIVGFYFILLTLLIIGLFGLINRRLNKHLPTNERKRLRFNKYNLIR